MSAGLAGALGSYGSNGAGFGGTAMNSGATGSLLSNGMHAPNMQQQQQQQQMQQQQQQQGSAGGGGSQTSGPAAGTSDNGAPAQPEYTLAGILHFLQSEWRRYERDRNEWEIERAEMRARIALLEGERRGVENLKTDLMRRVKMLEYALRQERNKYLSGTGQQATGAPSTGAATGIPASKFATLQGLERATSSSGRSSPARAESEGPEPRGAATFSNAGFASSTIMGPGATMNGSGSALSRQPTSNSKDPRARAKSRDYLKQCLQEISYLTSASTLNPLPDRAAPGAAGMLQRPRKVLPDNVPASQAAAPEAPSAAAPQPPALQPTGILQRPIANIGSAQAKGVPRASALTATRPAQVGAEQGRKVGEASPLHESDTIEDEPLQTAAGDDPLGASRALSEDASSQPGDEVTPYLTDDQPSAPPPAPSAGVAALPADDAPLDEEQDQVTAVYRGPGAAGNTSGGSASDWAKLKEVGQREREKREARRAREDGGDAAAPDAAALALTSERVTQLMKASGKAGGRTGDEELASLSMEPEEDAAATSRAAEDNSSQLWKAKRVLRNHLDAVRAIAFDGPDAISASDDNTIKFWRLDPATLEQPSARSGSDTEPILTYRGHAEPVTCVAVSSAKRRMYSGSMDASVRVWRLPERSTGPYPPFEDMEIATLAGHTQAVWDMALLPLSDDSHVLATVSADGSVKIWNTDVPGLRLSWDYYGTEGSADADAARAAGALPVPTSVSICHSNLRACAVSYSDSVVKLFEIETGRELLVLKSTETYDGTPSTQINKCVSHPTLPLLVTAHEDKYIRMFDLESGDCVLSMQAHLDAVTALDIDPAGLTLVSGGHDCSVRFWDIIGITGVSSGEGKTGAGGDGSEAGEARQNVGAVCVQEISSHRKKSGEGVLAVLYHPSAPYFASAGADGIVRLYG